MFCAAALAGCTAEMVQKKPPRKGPVPEVGLIDKGNGDIRYSVEGWAWVIAGRRRTALRKIKKLCKDLSYSIIDEFTREDVEVPYSQDELDTNMDKGVRHYNISPFHHILFDCVPKKP